jgi:hypothetical protein
MCWALSKASFKKAQFFFIFDFVNSLIINIEGTVPFSGAWGKMIHEKNLKQNISRHCPFKCFLALHFKEHAPPTCTV